MIFHLLYFSLEVFFIENQVGVRDFVAYGFFIILDSLIFIGIVSLV